jgi:hypothetical protein
MINKTGTMFFNLFRTKVSQVNTLFLGHYVDPKVFYAVQFNKVPCISFIGELDTSKAFDFVQSTYRGELAGIYQHNYFDHDKRDFFFNNTLFVLKDKRMIELGNNYCHGIIYKGSTQLGTSNDKRIICFPCNR